MGNYHRTLAILINLRNVVCCLLMGAFVTACSIFEPLPTPPIHYFTIAGPPTLCDENYCYPHRELTTILVNLPRASAAYNSQRMIYIPSCLQIQYFAKNRWIDMPTQMLQPLLTNALQNTGYFQAIINTPTAIYYDWILNTQLLSFQQEFLTRPSQFRIALRAQLIDARSRCVIATEDFVVTQTAPCDNPYGGAIAANIATQKILDEIACFCLRYLD